jgi:hypothetical protein
MLGLRSEGGGVVAGEVVVAVGSRERCTFGSSTEWKQVRFE